MQQMKSQLSASELIQGQESTMQLNISNIFLCFAPPSGLNREQKNTNIYKQFIKIFKFQYSVSYIYIYGTQYNSLGAVLPSYLALMLPKVAQGNRKQKQKDIVPSGKTGVGIIPQIVVLATQVIQTGFFLLQILVKNKEIKISSVQQHHFISLCSSPLQSSFHHCNLKGHPQCLIKWEYW